jgi:hypothetical protein
MNCYLPFFRQWLISHLLSTSYFCRFCLLKVHAEHGPSPVLWCAQTSPPSLLHVLFSSLFSQFFFFYEGQGQSVQRAILVYPRGSCGNTACHLFAHLLACISQAGLEPVSGGLGALLFSQCSVAWRSFVQPGGSGCCSFASSWSFFSAKGGSSISARFLIYRAHAVCFLPLVAILNLTSIGF